MDDEVGALTRSADLRVSIEARLKRPNQRTVLGLDQRSLRIRIWQRPIQVRPCPHPSRPEEVFAGGAAPRDISLQDQGASQLDLRKSTDDRS